MPAVLDPVRPFVSRPDRVRACPTCAGHGRVAAPYYLVSYDQPIPGAPVGAIMAMVCGAASIFEATHEAHDIAVRWALPVAFDFNGLLVVVRSTDVPAHVANAWWLERYGETQEQSAARR
jgi:hypothetical protein